MSRLLAILFGLALLLPQGGVSISLAGAMSGTAKNITCAHCSCGKMSCCVQRAPSTPQPPPFAPVRSASQHETGWNPALAQETKVSQLLSSLRSFSLFVPCVPTVTSLCPVYQRNCTYLI